MKIAKRHIYKVLTGCLSALLLPLLASCEHKDLCYSHPHSGQLEVVFDWKEAPDANPATMSLYLYPSDGSAPIRYEFTDRNGGVITVPADVYDVICANSDRETQRVIDKDKRTTFQVTTANTRSLRGMLAALSETAPRARGAEAERNVFEPEALWSDHAERLEVGSEQGVKKIVLTPKPRVRACTVEIRNVENLRHATAVSAAVTGMAGGWLAGIDELSEEKVTIPFEMNAVVDKSNTTTTDKSMLTGLLTTFGHCPKIDSTHKLMLYAQMSDGNTYYIEEDVTAQLHDPAQDPLHIKIVLEKLPLPKPITGGEGLLPSVKEWQEIYIDLPMN